MKKQSNEHIASVTFLNNLHPDHLKDLRKSGLSDETIQEARIYSVSPRDINKKLAANYPYIESLIAFPYPGCGGFERYKPFPSIVGQSKYLQKKGIKNHLYIPEKVRPILSDPSVDLYFTEGEKKTLKACQEGLYCIGSGGLWNWSDGSEDKNLISDFDLIEWKNRTVYLIPDNDWLNPNRHGYKKNLRQAVYELAYRLIDREARVYIIELPQGRLKGLDDFLCQHLLEELKALPEIEIRKQTVQEMIGEASLDTLPEILKRLANLKETERAFYINELAKKLDVPKRAIQKDLKRCEPHRADDTEILTTAYFPELVDLCLDENRNIAFLINEDSNLKISTKWEIDGSLYKPPDKNKIPFFLPRGEGVLTWVSKDADKALFCDLLNYLKRFSFIPEHQFIFVSHFIFLTYIHDHPDIQYFPMLLFWSAPERGKSRTGKAVIYCSYRGVYIVDLREANLFRYSQDFHSTLFIDMMDLWKKAERNQSQDILLLRYERGAKVARVLYPEKGSFKDMVYFDVYGPTVMATNEPVHHILDTRCLPISMPNKPHDYENPTPEKLTEIRERLTAWRARVMGKPLPMVDPVPGINGRLWDISQPLFQVCGMVSPGYSEMLKMAILEIAGERVEERSESTEGQIVKIIKDLSPEIIPDWSIEIQEIVDRLNEKRPEGHRLTPRYVGQKIKALSLKKRRTSAGFRVELTRSAFNTLLSQFGIEYFTNSPPSETFTTFTNTNKSKESDCHNMNIGMNIDEYPSNVHQTFIDKNQDISDGYECNEQNEHSTGGKECKLENLFEAMDDGQLTY